MLADDPQGLVWVGGSVVVKTQIGGFIPFNSQFKDFVLREFSYSISLAYLIADIFFSSQRIVS